MVPPNASRSRGAGGTGTDAARGDPCEVQREANLTLIDPAAPVDCGTFHAARTERFFSCPARRLVSLSLQQRDWLRPGRRSWPCCWARMVLEAAAYASSLSRCNHPRGQSIPAPAGRAAPDLAVEPAMLTPAVPSPQRRRKSAGCARQAASRSACHRTPSFLVNCAHIAAAAAPPHACSDCACLPVVPDKQRLCTLVVGRRLQASNPIL